MNQETNKPVAQEQTQNSDARPLDSVSHGMGSPPTSKKEDAASGGDNNNDAEKKKYKKIYDWLHKKFPDGLTTDHILAICNIILVIVTIFMAHYSSMQADSANLAADSSAQQAKNSQESFNIENRPYVFITSITMDEFAANKPAKVRIIIKNFGKSPAFDLEFKTAKGIYPIKETPPFPTEFKLDELATKDIIAPNDDRRNSSIGGRIISESEYNAIIHKTAFYFVFGIIEYNDMFKGHTIVKFCARYNGEGTGFQIRDKHNTYEYIKPKDDQP